MAFSKNRRLADLISADGTGFITSSHITDTSITPTDLHSTLDLTGKTVTVATASAGDNDTTVASTAFVSTAVSNLVASAPGTLNTLNELAAALGDDASFSTTVTNSIATKLPLAGGTMTGNIAHASDFTLDVGGDINLDADGADINLKDGGTAMGRLGLENGDLNIASSQQDYDIRLKGNDGGSVITALHLDMSQAGYATFNSGVSLGGETKLGDNSKLILGNGDDLQIYHDGSHSIITDQGTGSLLLRGTAGVFIQNAEGTENIIAASADGAVTLYHDNSPKLATTASGIKIGAGSPSVHYTGYEALDIGTSLSLMSNNSSTNISTLTNNGYLNSNASNWVRKVQDESSMFEQVSGQHRFKSAGSGSAGSAITWLERMRIHANGKVGFSANGMGDVNTIPRDFAFFTEGSTNGVEIRSNDQRLIMLGAGGSGGAASDDGYLTMSSQE